TKVAIASGSGVVTSSGVVTLKLKRSTSKAARSLKGKRVSATLAVTFRPQAGGKATTFNKRVTVKP
ncbi:MAG: hypothetical protein QOF86_3299, partial [Baekduia sp.]|nr:hypothetical protein [Baekduia sp.]